MPHPDPAVMPLLARVYDSRNSYFDDEGRYSHRIPSTFTEAEHQQLRAAGLVPNVFTRWAHDEAIDRLRQSAAAVDPRQAADAFVASMVSADPAWLTVLPATALGRAMPVHAEQPMGGGSCRVCFYKADAIDTTQAAYFRHLTGAGWGDSHPAYCHEVRTDERGIVRGRMEVLDLLSPTPPTAGPLAGTAFRDRRNGKRWQMWCSGLDKTPGVKRIAIDVPAPTHAQPVPERLEVGGARDLKHLAGWNFDF